MHATFTVTGVDTGYANEFGVFAVDDATGRIGALLPGDAGYTAAAMSEAGQRVVFANGPTAGKTATLDVPGGSYLGLYLVQNSTTASFKSNNPDDLLRQRPFVFFLFAAANPDRFDHVRETATNQYDFEDLFAGGDRDFNDLEVRVDFAQPVGSPSDHQPPTVQLTAPAPGLQSRVNPTVAGRAMDDSSGLASVEAGIDGGPFFPVTFDGSGQFTFNTSLPVDGSADARTASCPRHRQSRQCLRLRLDIVRA